MKSLNKKILVTLFFSFSILINAQDKLVIKGSDTLGAKMIPKIAEAYENKNPGSKFEIAAEGSSTG
ncbi:MAG: phosphate-binding protein, partial [Opitutae bacterium]|nr:phosphate-binding protein [Opitutae bacterium]